MRLLTYVFLLAAASTVFAAPQVKLGGTTLIGRDIPSLEQEFFGGTVVGFSESHLTRRFSFLLHSRLTICRTSTWLFALETSYI
jgi:hypothetical protein